MPTDRLRRSEQGKGKEVKHKSILSGTSGLPRFCEPCE
jgi:hypothetical protein